MPVGQPVRDTTATQPNGTKTCVKNQIKSTTETKQKTNTEKIEIDGRGATQHKRKRVAKPELNGNRYLNLSNLGL